MEVTALKLVGVARFSTAKLGFVVVSRNQTFLAAADVAEELLEMSRLSDVDAIPLPYFKTVDPEDGVDYDFTSDAFVKAKADQPKNVTYLTSVAKKVPPRKPAAADDTAPSSAQRVPRRPQRATA